MNKEVNLATVHPLMTELLAIENLIAGGIDDDEIPQVKKISICLASWRMS